MTKSVILETWVDVGAEVDFGPDIGPCICVTIDEDYAFFPIKDLPIDGFWGLDMPKHVARGLVADALRELANRVEQNETET